LIFGSFYVIIFTERNKKGKIFMFNNAPNIRYFSRPTQVLFWDIDGYHYVYGIAYRDEIICGCCGGIMSIEEVYEFAPKTIRPILVDDYWCPLDDDIDVSPAIANAYTEEEIDALATEYSIFCCAKQYLEWRK
jgi:hypothetical protein